MVNLYDCNSCGYCEEIPDGHIDNTKINVAGIIYVESCRHCEGPCDKVAKAGKISTEGYDRCIGLYVVQE